MLEFLVDVTLRGETQRVAFYGIATPDGYYAAELLELTGIENRVPVIPGAVRPQSFTVALNDGTRRWSELKHRLPFIGGTVEVKWGDLAQGFSDFETLASGRIVNWSRGEAAINLEVEDDSAAVLDAPFPWRAEASLFPNLPEQDAALVPICYNELDVTGGAMPCVQVDALRYACTIGTGRIDEVGYVERMGGAYTTVSGFTTSQITAGDFQVTVIDFNSSPTDEPLRWNGRGIDINNPAEQWKDLLEKLDVETHDASFTEAADELDTRGISGAIAVTGLRQTLRSVARDLSRSCNLQTFVARDGSIGCDSAVPDPRPSNPIELLEADTVGESFQMRHPGTFLTGAAYQYGPQHGESARYLAQSLFRDMEERAIQGGRDALDNVQMPFQQQAASALAVIQDRIFFGQETRLLVSVDVRPEKLRQIPIGAAVELTHSLGIGDGGFRARPMRALGSGIEVTREELKGTLRLVTTDFVILPVTKAGFEFLANERLPRMRSTRGEFPIHRAQRRFDPSLR